MLHRGRDRQAGRHPVFHDPAGQREQQRQDCRDGGGVGTRTAGVEARPELPLGQPDRLHEFGEGLTPHD